MNTESSLTKGGSPVWLGVKLFLVDLGISSVLGFAYGFAIGFIFGTDGLSQTQILTYYIPIGLLVSFYAMFLLYKRYSQHTTALISAIVAILIVSALSFQQLVQGDMSMYQSLLTIFLTVIAYCVGWYVAQRTSLKLFLLGDKWVTAFFIVGLLALFFVALSFIKTLVA